MRILVTGGAGFIGSHLCDRLLTDGHQVWSIDNLSTGSEDNLTDASRNSRFTALRGDVCDELPHLAVDQIYSFACPASPRNYQLDPIATLSASVLGTLNALHLCKRNEGRLLLASTSAIYGDPGVHPQPEAYVGAVSCTGPHACNDEGKRAAETLCYDFHRQHGTEIRIARLFNTYGPRMSAGDGRIVPDFVNQAILGEPLRLFGAGTQTRSFCYIDDMVEALVRLMEKPARASDRSI